MAFVPLHNHSDYSLLDGASQLPQMVERAVELGMTALALTDHGVMYGAIELLKLCGKAGIKPIIGNEMYVINGSIEDPQPKKERRYHLVVLAKNGVGYRNLVKLTSISHLRGMRGRGIFARACIDKQLLRQYSEGLIVSTACLGGEIPQAILKGRPDVARSVAAWYQEVFGPDFYLEIQDHGGIEDRIVNVEMARIGSELGIPLVATNDAHYLSVGDVEAHDALLCVLTGKLISDEKRLRYTGTEYIRSEAEMRGENGLGGAGVARHMRASQHHGIKRGEEIGDLLQHLRRRRAPRAVTLHAHAVTPKKERAPFLVQRDFIVVGRDFADRRYGHPVAKDLRRLVADRFPVGFEFRDPGEGFAGEHLMVRRGGKAHQQAVEGRQIAQAKLNDELAIELEARPSTPGWCGRAGIDIGTGLRH